jgi:hypothetical protein
MPSGLVWTILVAESYKPQANDNRAFVETLDRVGEKLSAAFECLRPTAPKGEDLLQLFNTRHRAPFLNRLQKLLNIASSSLESSHNDEEYLRELNLPPKSGLVSTAPVTQHRLESSPDLFPVETLAPDMFECR